MGYFLEKMGEYAQSLLLCEESLRISGQVLGKQHPDYAHGLNNLARIELYHGI